MGRPRTPVGQAGKITVTGKPGAYTARARFRDSDGRSRLVESGGTTKAKAEAALKARLADRQRAVRNSEWRPDMTVGAAAEKWLSDEMPKRSLSESSRNLYQGNVRRYVLGSRIEHLTLAEANRVHTLESWLGAIINDHGKGAAKGARSVLSHVLNTAVRFDVLPFNALKGAETPDATKARETARTKQGKEPRNTRRSFTEAEREHVHAVAATNPTAIKYDVGDLLHFLDGTGVRINEALTVRWEDMDLTTGRVHVKGTKTAGSNRVLHMSPRLTERMAARLDRLRTEDKAGGVVGLAGRGVVFHSPGTADREKPRNRDNLIKKVRTVLDAAGYEWATSHSFRRSVVTRIVEGGHDLGMAADQVGHANIRTTFDYVGRNRDTSGLTDVL